MQRSEYTFCRQGWRDWKLEERLLYAVDKRRGDTFRKQITITRVPRYPSLSLSLSFSLPLLFPLSLGISWNVVRNEDDAIQRPTLREGQRYGMGEASGDESDPKRQQLNSQARRIRVWNRPRIEIGRVASLLAVSWVFLISRWISDPSLSFENINSIATPCYWEFVQFSVCFRQFS